MTDFFLHLAPTFKSDIIPNMFLKHLVFIIEDSFPPWRSQSKLYGHLTVLKSVRVDIDLLVKRDISDGCSGGRPLD